MIPTSNDAIHLLESSCQDITSLLATDIHEARVVPLSFINAIVDCRHAWQCQVIPYLIRVCCSSVFSWLKTRNDICGNK